MSPQRPMKKQNNTTPLTLAALIVPMVPCVVNATVQGNTGAGHGNGFYAAAWNTPGWGHVDGSANESWSSSLNYTAAVKQAIADAEASLLDKEWAAADPSTATEGRAC